MTSQYPDLGSASDWLKQISHTARPIRSNTQIWVVTRHQYGISALILRSHLAGKAVEALPNVGCFFRPTQNNISDYKMPRWRRQRERQKRNRLNRQNNNSTLCTCITHSCTFLCRHCTTTTGNCLISRFMEDVNKRRLNFLSILEYGSQKFGSKRVRLYLA